MARLVSTPYELSIQDPWPLVLYYPPQQSALRRGAPRVNYRNWRCVAVRDVNPRFGTPHP